LIVLFQSSVPDTVREQRELGERERGKAWAYVDLGVHLAVCGVI